MLRPARQAVFTDEVLAAIPMWVSFGASRKEIADALGTTVGSLEQTCIRWGISLSGGLIANLALQRGLSSDRWLRLRREATERGVPIAQLVVDLMDKIAADDLFDAVLDDRGDGEEESGPCSAA